jgi:type IX secretion system PorP/SprF family membrane protein
MVLFRRFLTVLFLVHILICKVSYGQQTPLNPVSYRIFSPFVFNPAIAGSKDFSSLDFIAGWNGKSNSQIVSENLRLSRKDPDYISSYSIKSFTNFGFGCFLFNEQNSESRNSGASLAISYQITLDKKALSFLSFGASVKGVRNTLYSVTSSDPLLAGLSENTIYPNVDLGVYYYGPNLFAGFSGTNLIGNPEDPDSLGIYSMPVSRQYFFNAGCKILLNSALNIVLEPSVIINGEFSSSQKVTDILKPMLKIYAQDFCLGTYFNDYNNTSFFIQYMFPRFYVGTFFEIPRNSPFYKKELNVEFALGINFSKIKSGNLKYYHW